MLKKIKKSYLLLALSISVCVQSSFVFALGVPANTTISNTATISYDVSGFILSTDATASFTVIELLDISVVWQDAANIIAITSENNVVLTYEITNIGNGVEQYLLAVNGALPGDDFDIPALDLEIWIDDGDGNWSVAADTLYDGTNGPVLTGSSAANDSVIVFVVADVPAGLSFGDLSNIELTATSSTADTAGEVGNTATEIIGAGDGGVNAVVGVSGAIANAIGTIEIDAVGVSINKSVTVTDTFGGTEPHTGATLRYRLDVQIAGSSNIDDLVIVDPIPNVTSYTASSISLNSIAQTDAQDAPADFSDFNFSNSNSVTVDLSQGGTVSVVPPTNYVIEFEVTID